MSVLPLFNAGALEADPVRDLFARAFANEAHADGDAVRKWLAERIPSDEIGVFVALDDGRLDGLAIIGASPDPFSPPSTILHFYSERRQDVRCALVEAMARWMRERDISTVWAFNQTGRSDAVHMRAFRRFARGSVRCSAIEYELE